MLSIVEADFLRQQDRTLKIDASITENDIIWTNITLLFVFDSAIR